MENTGLVEALEVIYASNTVRQILSGKAVSRARRAHFLVDSALNLLLLSDVLKLPLPGACSHNEDVETITTTQDFSDPPALDKVNAPPATRCEKYILESVNQALNALLENDSDLQYESETELLELERKLNSKKR